MTVNSPLKDSQFLPPKLAADFLKTEGFPTSAPTLAKLRCIGGGPAFRRYGRRIVYERIELIRWIEARLSPARRSTSDRGEVHHGE
jgi:hypothetical protein